jgi:hypothetical protein
MDPDAPRDLRLAHPALKPPGRLQAPLFELPTILCDPGWMSHAPQYTGCVGKCHYVM